MRTNSKDFKAIMNQYLFDSLNDIDNELNDIKKVANYSYNRFKNEFCHAYELKRTPNIKNRLSEYLQGLPFQIDFDNYRILELAKQWEQLPNNATEKQEDKIIANWFNFISYQILKFWERNGLNIYDLNK